MHPELKTFFDTHRNATAAHRRSAHDHVAPVSRATADSFAHLAELEAQLDAAETAATADPTTLAEQHTLYDWMRGRLNEAKNAADEARKAQRAFARAMSKLELAFDEREHLLIERILDAQSPAAQQTETAGDVAANPDSQKPNKHQMKAAAALAEAKG